MTTFARQRTAFCARTLSSIADLPDAVSPLGEVVELHQRLIAQSGGGSGLRDLGLVESALAQPRASFDGADLHETIVDKAAALGFALVANHPFVDGNKRIGHAAMEVFLLLNGCEIEASVDDQERTVLDVASGRLDRAGLSRWLKAHIVDAGS